MHSRNSLRALLFAVLLLPLLSGSLSATLVQYSDRATWEATTPGFTHIDFEITSGFDSYNTAAGLSLGGVQFVGVDTPGNYLLTVVDSVVFPDHSHDSGDVLKGPGYQPLIPNKGIEANLPGGVNSFGVDLMTYFAGSSMAPSQTFHILLSTGDPVTPVVTLIQRGRAFLGVVSSDPITQVKFVLASGPTGETFPMIDNFDYGNAALVTATPEASTYLLVGGGLLIVALLRRRQFGRVQ